MTTARAAAGGWVCQTRVGNYQAQIRVYGKTKTLGTYASKELASAAVGRAAEQKDSLTPEKFEQWLHEHHPTKKRKRGSGLPRGVSQQTPAGNYQAQFNVYGKTKTLGTYASKELASAAVGRAAEQKDSLTPEKFEQWLHEHHPSKKGRRSSGLPRGVFLTPAGNYEAQITIQRKTKTLGTYASKELASAAVGRAAEQKDSLTPEKFEQWLHEHHPAREKKAKKTAETREKKAKKTAETREKKAKKTAAEKAEAKVMATKKKLKEAEEALAMQAAKEAGQQAWEQECRQRWEYVKSLRLEARHLAMTPESQRAAALSEMLPEKKEAITAWLECGHVHTSKCLHGQMAGRCLLCGGWYTCCITKFLQDTCQGPCCGNSGSWGRGATAPALTPSEIETELSRAAAAVALGQTYEGQHLAISPGVPGSLSNSQFVVQAQGKHTFVRREAVLVCMDYHARGSSSSPANPVHGALRSAASGPELVLVGDIVTDTAKSAMALMQQGLADIDVGEELNRIWPKLMQQIPADMIAAAMQKWGYIAFQFSRCKPTTTSKPPETQAFSIELKLAYHLAHSNTRKATSDRISSQYTRQDIADVRMSCNSKALSVVCALSKWGCRIHYYAQASGMNLHSDADDGHAHEKIRYSMCFNLSSSAAKPELKHCLHK